MEKIISIRIKEDELEELDNYCESADRARSEIIRIAISRYLFGISRDHEK